MPTINAQVEAETEEEYHPHNILNAEASSYLDLASYNMIEVEEDHFEYPDDELFEEEETEEHEGVERRNFIIDA